MTRLGFWDLRDDVGRMVHLLFPAAGVGPLPTLQSLLCAKRQYEPGHFSIYCSSVVQTTAVSLQCSR
jgi:hypothetical protein